MKTKALKIETKDFYKYCKTIKCCFKCKSLYLVLKKDTPPDTYLSLSYDKSQYKGVIVELYDVLYTDKHYNCSCLFDNSRVLSKKEYELYDLLYHK